MASPQFQQMAVFPEAVRGRANIVSGGLAYQCSSDGAWRSVADHKEKNEQVSGAEAPLADSVVTTVRGWEGVYRRAFRTHGEELWWRWLMGDYDRTPSARSGLYEKRYFTHRRGPQGTLTVAQDRYSHHSVAPTLYRTVYPGCKARSWGLTVVEDQPVQVEAEWVCPADGVTTTGGVRPLNAPQAAATTGRPEMFHWANCRLQVGVYGREPTVNIVNLNMLRMRVDNQLNTSRFYTDGPTNMADPAQQKTNMGRLTLEFDSAAVVDTYIVDPYNEGNGNLSMDLLMSKPPYSARLRMPWVHLLDVKESGGAANIGVVTASADIRWDSAGTAHAAELSILTEGSQG